MDGGLRASPQDERHLHFDDHRHRRAIQLGRSELPGAFPLLIS